MTISDLSATILTLTSLATKRGRRSGCRQSEEYHIRLNVRNLSTISGKLCEVSQYKELEIKDQLHARLYTINHHVDDYRDSLSVPGCVPGSAIVYQSP